MWQHAIIYIILHSSKFLIIKHVLKKIDMQNQFINHKTKSYSSHVTKKIIKIFST